MVSLTDEQFQKYMEFITTNQRNTIGGGSGGKSVLLDERHFRRMEMFEGSELKWSEWRFSLGVSVKAADSKIATMMSQVESADPRAATTERMREEMKILGDEQVDWFDKASAEVFGHLCQLTKGKPNGVVRTVED